MELWVRSQSKRHLAKITNINVTPANINGVQKYSIIGDFESLLGTYDTKQRCLEILDEIQNLISDSGKTLVTLKNDFDMRDYDELLYELEKNKIAVVSQVENAQVFPLQTNIVYQMPEK